MLNHYVAFNRLDKIKILGWGTVSQLVSLVTSKVKSEVCVIPLIVGCVLHGEFKRQIEQRKKQTQ